MPKGQTSHRLYAHITWCTEKRANLLNSEAKTALKSIVNHTCDELGYKIIAFNVVEEHVHLLIRFKPSHQLSNIVKLIKGRSSWVFSNQLKKPIKWQRGYGIHTVGYRALEVARRYVLNQEKHHYDDNSNY